MKKSSIKISILLALVLMLFATASASTAEVLDSNRYLFTLPTVATEEWKAITVTEPCSAIEVTLSGTFDSSVGCGIYPVQSRVDSTPIIERGIALSGSNAISEETTLSAFIETPGTYWIYVANSSHINPYYYGETGTNTSGIICEYKVIKGDKFENNNVMEKATPLTANTAHKFNLAGTGDRDWFKFTAYDLTTPLSVSITSEDGKFDAAISYTVYHLNEATGALDRVGGVGDANYASGATAKNTTKSYTLEDVGDYYIAITNSANINSHYYWGDNQKTLTLTTNIGFDESKIAQSLNENEFLLKIYDKNGAVKDLPVIVNNYEYITDQNGFVIFSDEIDTKETVQSISVSIGDQDGKYSPYHMNPFYINKNTKVGFIKLKYADDSDYELISAMIDKYDVLNGTKKGTLREDVKTKITLQTYSEVGIKKYAIVQNEEIVAESLTREIEVAQGSFKIGEDVYAVIYGEGDEILSKTLLNVKVIAIDTQFIKELKFANKFNVKVPADNPYMGDANLEIKLNEGVNDPSFIIKDDTVKIGINIKIEDLSDKRASEWLRELGKTPIGLTQLQRKNEFSFTTKTGVYMELKFCDGLLVSSGGSALMQFNVKGEVSKDFILPVGAIAIPLTTTVSAEGELKFEPSVKANVYTGNIEYENLLEAKVEAGISIGVGITDASVGVYGKGEIKATYKNLSDIESVKAEIDAGVYGKVGPVELKQTLSEIKDFMLYPDVGIQEQQALSADLYNLSEYSLVSRSYLANRTKFYENSPQSIYNTTLQSKVYPYIEPQIVNNNGTIIMAYLDDNGGEDNANFQQLVYSIYNGKWKTPIAIDEDSNIENSFHLYTDGNDIYLAYTELKSTILESTTPEEMASLQEIVVAKYDKTQSKFVDIATLTSNNTYDYNPKIVVKNNVPTVVWLNNADNNMFGNTANNSIYYSSFESGNWTTPEILATNIPSISKMEMGILNSNIAIAYITDTDNNLATSEDRKLNTINLEKRVTELAKNVTSSYLEFTKYNNEDILVWLSAETIKGTTNLGEIKDIYVNDNIMGATNIKLRKNFDGNNIITYIKPVLENGKYVDRLHAVNGTNNNWKQEYIAYDNNNGNYIDAYDIVNASTSRAYIVLVASDVNDSTLERTATYLQTKSIYPPSVSKFDVKDVTLSENNTVKLTLVVDNITAERQTLIDFSLFDDSGEAVISDQAINGAFVESGDVKEIPLQFTLPDGINSNSYYLDVTEKAASASSYNSGKTSNFNVKFVDFEVYSEQIVMNGKNYLSLTVTNNGYYTTSAVLGVYKVNASEESMIDEKIKSIVTGKLEHGKSENYLIEITDDYLPDGKTDGVIKVVANSFEGIEELAITDNTTSVAMTEFKEELPYKKGDINKDGLVDSADAAIALNIFKYNNATEEDLKIGDMDENGMIDSADAAMILNVFKYGL